MNKTILSFIITILSGLSTTLGIIPCFFKAKNQNKIISTSLAFASGIMLSISLISLIPESSNLLSETFLPIPSFLICSIFIISGIFICTIIDDKIDKKLSSSKLHKLGIISAIVLMLHNIPEGMTTFISTSKNTELGIKLAIAIALHNIPEGISIAIPIYYSTQNKIKALTYTLLAGFSELLGAIISYVFLQKFISNLLLSIILLVTAGIMINISIYEFIPKAFEKEKNKSLTLAFVIGILIIFLTEIYLI